MYKPSFIIDNCFLLVITILEAKKATWIFYFLSLTIVVLYVKTPGRICLIGDTLLKAKSQRTYNQKCVLDVEVRNKPESKKSGKLWGCPLKFSFLYIRRLILSTVSSGHQWYSQGQWEQYQEGLQSPGSGDEGLQRTGSFLSILLVKGNGLKEPDKSGKSTNGYRAGAAARDSAT